MDSVDGCCGPRKTDSFQSAQVGSSPKKVDLIIWEIEVPKVRAARSTVPQAQGHRAEWGGIVNPKQPPSEPGALEKRRPTFCEGLRASCDVKFLQLPSGGTCSVLLSFKTRRLLTLPLGFLGFAGAPICLEMLPKTRLRTWASPESLCCACSELPNAKYI